MKDWIPFNDGEYLAEQAFLTDFNTRAVRLDEAVISIFSDAAGRRGMSGRCKIRNHLLVQLMDESDDIHLILDFGDEFKYILKFPELTGGKVFSPNVISSLQFAPREPWEQIPIDQFEELRTRLKILSP